MNNLSDEDPKHALDLLAGEVGGPKKLLVETIIAGTSDAELIEVGTQIDSRRITVDAARIYGQAWAYWTQADPKQRQGLRGLSRELLALAIQEAVTLEAMRQKRAGEAGDDVAGRAAADAAAVRAADEGLALRDQAYSALRDAGQAMIQRDEVNAAVCTAETPEKLAQGLKQLAKVLTGWLESDDKNLKGRLVAANLDAEYAAELDAAAAEVLATAAKASRPTTGKVTQGALDRQDGVNILLLGQVIRAFEAAHNRSPTVPRLVPISTRRMFNRKAKKAGQAPGDAGSAAQTKTDAEKKP